MNAALRECFHCGLPVPRNGDFTLQVAGELREFCCPGCRAVAAAIVDGGLDSFYRFRSDNNSRPDNHTVSFDAFDQADVQEEFVHHYGDVAEASLLLGGISCAACVWLIERYLGSLDGLVSVRVNASTHRCLVRWQPAVLSLSQLMTALAEIGYTPMPATQEMQQALRQQENRKGLMRLAVAGFGMMQVGMVATAMYAGADEGWESYFRWVSLLISIPVVLFSARPFFSAAKRALMTRHLTMDVPVSLAISGAWLASIWATFRGGGEVYFDSIAMFTFFLLLGRFLEMRARHRNGIDAERLGQLLPLTIQRWTGESWQTLPLKQARVDDRLLVMSGTCIPCDGVVLSGSGGVIETLLTGEPDPIYKQPGDSVIAGSMTADTSFEIQVTATGSQTQLSAIERLVEQAQQEKPKQVAVADRLAGYFVAAVLLVTIVVGSFWWWRAGEEAIWVVLSILVVTCPCALSLASPTALTASIGWLRQQGLLITRGHVLETLPTITTVVFDKTGTLTEGSPNIVSLHDQQGMLVSEPVRHRLMAICAALERGSNHPLARAFDSYRDQLTARELQHSPGQGVAGEIQLDNDGDIWRCRLGRPDFAGMVGKPPHVGQWLALSMAASSEQRNYWLQLRDELRSDAVDVVDGIKAQGLEVVLLSGDTASVTQQIADSLAVESWRGDQRPEDKLADIRQRQARGEKVLMVGDGINDVPVLSAADVSIAMGGATDLAQTRADSVLLNNQLLLILAALRKALETKRIIRQNIGWAIGYNLVALPLAAAGMIPPWAAAIGMSASSLLVVGNALRLSGRGRANPAAVNSRTRVAAATQ